MTKARSRPGRRRSKALVWALSIAAAIVIVVGVPLVFVTAPLLGVELNSGGCPSGMDPNDFARMREPDEAPAPIPLGGGRRSPIDVPPADPTPPAEHAPSAPRKPDAEEPNATRAIVVVDADGKPLDVRVVSAESAPSWFAFGSQSLFRINGTAPRRTDAECDFDDIELATPLHLPRDVKPGDRRSADARWLARPATTVAGRVRVVLDPAAFLVARVVDEAGVPVAAFDARVSGDGSMEGFRAKNGGFVAQWRRRRGEERDIDVTVIVTGDGFAPATRDLRIRSDAPSAETTITLQARSKDVATLVVRLIDPPPRLEKRTLEINLCSPSHPELVVHSLSAAWRDATTATVEAPSGEWRASVRAQDGWAHPLEWEGSLSLLPGRETEIRWTPVASGSLRIRAVPRADVWIMPTGARSSTMASHFTGDETIEHVPTGRWIVYAGEETKTVEVRAGEIAFADFLGESGAAPAK